MTLAEEAQRYLAAVEAIREEGQPDFLRYGSARDQARQERGDQGTLVERIEAYGSPQFPVVGLG